MVRHSAALGVTAHHDAGTSLITAFENLKRRKAAPALKSLIFCYRFCTGIFPVYYRFITDLLPIVYRFVTGHFRWMLLLQGA